VGPIPVHSQRYDTEPTQVRELQKCLKGKRLYLIFTTLFAGVFNSSGFCNSPKASEASKKTLNYLFAILQWGGGGKSFGLSLEFLVRFFGTLSL
jgi:hypothetical protein